MALAAAAAGCVRAHRLLLSTTCRVLAAQRGVGWRPAQPVGQARDGGERLALRWRACAAAADLDVSLNALRRRGLELEAQINAALQARAAATLRRRPRACSPQPPFPVPVQVADVDALRARLAELEEQAASADLWDRRERAQGVLQAVNAAREELAQLDAFHGQMDDLRVALELLEMEVRVCECARSAALLLPRSHPHSPARRRRSKRTPRGSRAASRCRSRRQPSAPS